MRLLVAFLYETILRSDLCDIKLYMTDPTAVRMEGFGIDIIYSVECEFFVDVCLCYHNSNDTYYVRIKKMEFVLCVPTYASQLDYYTPGSMHLGGGDLKVVCHLPTNSHDIFPRIGSHCFHLWTGPKCCPNLK